jgi:hypothetical protein
MEPDIAELENQMAAAETDMQTLVSNLTEEQGTAPPPNGSWSVASCLDHIVKTNDAYLAAMQPVAATARANGKLRRGAAKPGLLGRIFVNLLEPPVKPGRKMKAPATIQPAGVSLAEASASFLQSQKEVRSFLHANADLDLAGALFPNPFVRGIRFSLATGLCNLLAHERRHLWQARQVLLTRITPNSSAWSSHDDS